MNNYNFQADFSKFDPDTTRYTGENALFLTDCAKLAYDPEASVKQIIQDQLGFNNFKFFDGASTQAYIAGNDKMIIVAFRGTEMKIKDFLWPMHNLSRNPARSEKYTEAFKMPCVKSGPICAIV